MATRKPTTSPSAPALVPPSPEVVDEDVRTEPETRPEPVSVTDDSARSARASPLVPPAPSVVSRRAYAGLEPNDSREPDTWLVFVGERLVAECDSEAEARQVAKEQCPWP